MVGRLLRTRRWLLVAPALFVFWLVSTIDKTHISLIIADRAFLEELKLVGHNPELGGLMTAFFLGYGISIFVWGFLVDRFGPRACAVGGTICWGVFIYLSSRVSGIEEYLLIRFLLGAAEGNQWPVSIALTNRWFPVQEHSRVNAFWLGGSISGTALGVPVVATLMLTSGWRGALALLGILSLLPVVFLSFIRNWPREQKGVSPGELQEIERGQKESPAFRPMGLQEVLRSRPFWLITACQVISATTVFTMIHWLPSFLTSLRHLSFARMGDLLFIGYLMAAVFTITVGYIADRTMNPALTASGVCLTFVFAVLAGALLLPSTASALLLATLVGVGSSSAALQGSLMQTLVRPEAIARGTGIYVGIGTFASGLGPTVFGFLINRLEGQYWGGYLYLALLNAAAAGCFFLLHRLSRKAIPAVLVTTPVGN
ncbi:MAG: hypothetical protein A3J28_13410 [Acidobacteria bacterium RIFCSPLOWO2_12_FULL_60_22]|nr:MAG: hypothetical protein A3J28_13410 [Acidobacteria bacterium RIFCSPLOWO2_12_FULL_60_22]